MYKKSKQNDNIKFNTFINFNILYHIYFLLDRKKRIRMKSNHSNENVEIEKTNRVKENHINSFTNYIMSHLPTITY